MSDVAPFAPAPAELAVAPLAPPSLASALATVVERRYLAGLEDSRLRLAPVDEDASAPVLRQVRVIGRRGADEVGAAAMHGLLAACHNPSHDLVTVLHGDGARHQLYYGLRRRAGGGSFANAMAGLEGAFRAQMPGLALAEPAPLRSGGNASLAAFLETAGALASVTGIPSDRRAGGPQARAALDQIVAAMGGRPYALMVVAEALPIALVEEAMAACRSILSELHPQIGASVSASHADAVTETEQTSKSSGGILARAAPALVSAVAFAMGAGPLAPAISVAAMLATTQGDGAKNNSASQARNRSDTEGRTLSLLDADARYCSQLIERHHDRLTGARGSGWWRTAIYLAAEDEAALHCAAQALRGAVVGDATQLEPIRVQRPPAYLLRDAMRHGRLLRLESPVGAGEHPLGAAHQALATCINSEELAVVVGPPRAEAPGISLRDRGHFALTAPEVDGPAVALGGLIDGAGDVVGEVRVPARALNEHVLVVGTPGSGKTNTCMRLLIEAHERFAVPFLVIEPAKTEYRRLAREPSLQGKLRVYSVGGDGAPLRLNPLRPVPGVDLLGHIDLLKAVFNAAFAMFPGMPQILEQALIEVYEQRGWNLHTSRNDAAGANVKLSADEQEALLPSLSDLHDQVESVLRRRNYSEEVRRNIGAALSSRLNSLRLGNKGLILDTRHSTPLADLFDRPVVLELNNLRDDEEKSFVMALVLALLNQYAEARQAQYPEQRLETLQHVTLIEEAHRLLAAAPRGGAETADPRGKGVAIFTDMLAELRALGESFIVAEQIPTKLASDVLKNTNLKIIHKLTAPSDCAVLGDTANLDEAQLRYLVSLPTGTAVVHGLAGRAGEAVAGAALVRVEPVKDALRGEAPAPAGEPTARDSLYRLGGCLACASPCDFYADIHRSFGAAASQRAFRDFAEAVLQGDLAGAATGLAAWRGASPIASPTGGQLFCAFLHAAAQWTDLVLTARGVADDASAARMMRPSDRLVAHRLSKAFGAAGRALVDAVAPATADPALQRLRAALAEALTAPDRNAGLPACAACPGPCEALPFVAARGLGKLAADLAAALPKGPADAFGRPLAAAALREKVRQVLARSERPAPVEGGLDPATFAYCQLANAPLPEPLERHRAELLAVD